MLWGDVCQVCNQHLAWLAQLSYWGNRKKVIDKALFEARILAFSHSLAPSAPNGVPTVLAPAQH